VVGKGGLPLIPNRSVSCSVPRLRKARARLLATESARGGEGRAADLAWGSRAALGGGAVGQAERDRDGTEATVGTEDPDRPRASALVLGQIALGPSSRGSVRRLGDSPGVL